MRQKSKRIIAASSFALTAALIATVAANWTFITRIATYPKAEQITAEQWYEPMETVAGSHSAELPLANADEIEIASAALVEVSTWAASKNSTALVVMHRGQIVLERYWQGSDRHSRSNAMSMAKTIVALVTGIAIAEGAIESENDFAAKYLPEWLHDDRVKITIRHLLLMESGLRRDDSQTDPFSDLVQVYLNTDAAAVALEVPAVEPPGMRYEYNNINTQVLSLIIQRATGMRFTDYVSEKLWKPIGAGDAAYWLDSNDGMPKTFCCFFATARDWLRVGQLLLDRGMAAGVQVVPEDWIAKMVTASPREPDYGFQIWLAYSEDGRRKGSRTEPFIAKDMFYLDGQDSQRVYVIPSHELIIVRIGESAPEWDDAVLPNTLVRGILRNTQTIHSSQ